MLHRQSYTAVAVGIRHKSAARTLEFGRYKGLTYLAVVQSDPSYCAWVLDVASRVETSRAFAEFARYCQTRPEFKQNLKQQGFPCSQREACAQVGFGAHKELTYGEVVDRHPLYCDWVLQTVNETSPCAMLKFAAFLSTSSPGIETMVKLVRSLSDDAIQASPELPQLLVPEGIIEDMRKAVQFSSLVKPYHIAHMFRACRILQISDTALLTALEQKTFAMMKAFNETDLFILIWAIAGLPGATYALRTLALDAIALRWDAFSDMKVRMILRLLPDLGVGMATQKFLDVLTSIAVTQQSHNSKATAIGIFCAHSHEKCVSQGTLLPEIIVEELVRCADSLDHVDIVDIAWAMTKLNMTNQQLLDAVTRKAIDESSYLSAEQIAGVAFAYAKISIGNCELFEALAWSAVTKMDSFDEMNIANMAWSFATVRMFDAVLFEALASVAVRRRVEFVPQGISNMAWAFAKVSCKNDDLFGMLASAAIEMVSSLDEQAISNILWAFATQCRYEPSLMDTLANSIVHQSRQIKPQGISNIAWAFAKLDRYDSHVFAALKASALQQLRDFKAQNISNILWAVVKAGQHDESFVDAVARASFDVISEFTEQGISNILWAMVRSGFSSSTCGAELCSSLVQQAHVSNWAQMRDSPLGPRSAIEAQCAELISASVRTSLRNQVFLGFELDIAVPTHECIINIEIDGPLHQTQEQQLIDSRRDVFLGSLGIHVERVNPYNSTGAIRDDLSHVLHVALGSFRGAFCEN